MDGIESFNEAKNLARVAAGFKGSEFFTKPRMQADIPFKDGYPETVVKKFEATAIPQGTPTDPWNSRRK